MKKILPPALALLALLTCLLSLLGASPRHRAAVSPSPSLTEGLVAYYALDGNALDGSGNGNNGTIYGAVAPTTDRTGLAGGAMSFSGASPDSISIPHQDYLNINTAMGFTAAAWFWADTSGDIFKFILEKTWAGPSGYYLLIFDAQLPLRRFVSFDWPGGCSGGWCSIGAIVPVEGWHHVAVTAAEVPSQGTWFYLYLDGKLKDSVNGNAPLPSPSNLAMGSNGGQTVFFKGALDEVRIYNRALSPFEVASLYTYPQVPVPIANAGSNQTLRVGSPVQLDGSGSSDPLGYTPLTYAWTFTQKPPGSSASLSDATAVNPTFTLDKPGDYILQLIVTNSLNAASDPASVTINSSNSAPVAEAGPNQAVTLINTTVHLDGSQSYDPDDDPITYQWTMTSKPEGSSAALSDPTAEKPNFVADVHGDYVVSLVVSDPWTSSPADTVTVSFSNLKPVAGAGLPQSAVVGDTVQLNGAGSSDPNGDPLTYAWSFTTRPTGSTAALANPTAVNPTFVPDLAGTYVAQLIVNDGLLNSDPDTVSVEVVTKQTAVISALQELQALIGSFDLAVFKKTANQKKMITQLNGVIGKVQKGGKQYKSALKTLQNTFKKQVDGCAAAGAPDKNDAIIDCGAQGQVYDDLLEIIDLLSGMV